MFQRAQHHLRSHRPVAIFPVLILGLLFVGLTATLAACGTAQVQHCGQLHALNGHFSESADSVKQAENCFWQAFQCERPGPTDSPLHVSPWKLQGENPTHEPLGLLCSHDLRLHPFATWLQQKEDKQANQRNSTNTPAYPTRDRRWCSRRYRTGA